MESAADTKEKKETTRQQLTLITVPDKRAQSAGTARTRSPNVAPPKKARTMEDIDAMAAQDIGKRAQVPGDGFYGKAPTTRGRSVRRPLK